MVELIGDVDRRELYREDQHANVKGWCRALTRWSDGDTRARVRTAKLAAAFPAVAEALQDALLGVAQSHEIARAYANPRVRDQLGDVLDIFLEHAGLMPFEQFQQLVRRWESIADADGAHRSHEASHRQRRASMYLHEFTAELRGVGWCGRWGGDAGDLPALPGRRIRRRLGPSPRRARPRRDLLAAPAGMPGSGRGMRCIRSSKTPPPPHRAHKPRSRC